MNTIYVIGSIWWPVGMRVAQVIHLSPLDIENMRDEEGRLTRDSIESWLCGHAEDLEEIHDFSAYIEDEVDLDWERQESFEGFMLA